MKIRTFGQTAEITAPTRAQVVETMNLITDVRRAKGQTDYLAPYFYAERITAEIQAQAVETRIGNRADRLRSAGRLRRARVALAV